MSKLNCFLLLMVLVNLSWAHVTTTESPTQDTTLEVAVTENEDESPVEHITTKKPVVDIEAGSGDHIDDETEEVAKPKEDITCSAPGVQAHDSNCQLYHECTSVGSADGSFHAVTKSCPENEAFSTELQRCGREYSPCKPQIQCKSKGVIADPESNASYYLCQPKFSGSGFLIFRINCAKNEVFYPNFGRCMSSVEDVISNGLAGIFDTPDILLIKKEIYEYKKLYKQEINREKEERKAEEKLQKKQWKEAEKAAKLEKQLEWQARKLEAVGYTCATEGNFPSQVADTFYIGCIYRKNKISAIPLECSSEAKFNAQTGACVLNTTPTE